MHIFIAILSGLILNYLTGGFEFNTILCFMAGIFLIMPSLLNFKIGDFLLLKNHKIILFLDLIFGFIIIPFIFTLIGYLFFGESSITYSLLLLSLLPGGGMLFSWIQKTNGDIKIAFPLFFVNILIFSSIFFPLNNFLEQRGESLKKQNGIHQVIQEKKEICPIGAITYGKVNCNFGGESPVHPMGIIITLIIFPFLLSRVILLSQNFTNLLKNKIKLISQIATLLIIGYIFSLKSMNSIFDTSIVLVGQILGALTVIYGIVFIFIYKLNFSKLIDESLGNALFWNLSTRFITLGLVLSFVYIEFFGIEFIILMSLAYLVQISFSNIFAKIITTKK